MSTLTRLIAAILLSAAVVVEPLVFDVPSGSSKCLTEFLGRGGHSHVSYRVAEASSRSAVSMRVTGPDGEELHLTEGVDGAGEFMFEAAEGGSYIACFWTPHYERRAMVSVDVQWNANIRAPHTEGPLITFLRARAEGPLPAVNLATAKKGSTDYIAELKNLEDSARLIHEEMISLGGREGEMQRLNESTAVRICSFTLMSLAVCAGVAALQLWHLKAFFQKLRIL